MNTKYDVSIIIPSYNSKDTLTNTLESIKIQEVDFKYEVILVNDCSDYNYDDFINKYNSFFNIREIKTNVNSGPGISRQLGIDNSKSDYIVFIDSDDSFYDKDSLNVLYKSIKSTSSDLGIGNFLYKRDNKEIVKENNFIWLHGKIYNRDFLDKYNIRFNSSRQNEDNGFNRLILLLDPKVCFIKKTVYTYNENPNSITRKDNRSYKFYGLEGFCFNMNWAMEEAIKRDCKSNNISILSLDLLITLYVYYLGLYSEYNVDKIYEWSSPIKSIYLKNNDYTKNLDIDKLINNKIKFLSDEVTVNELLITFNEFINNIK